MIVFHQVHNKTTPKHWHLLFVKEIHPQNTHPQRSRTRWVFLVWMFLSHFYVVLSLQMFQCLDLLWQPLYILLIHQTHLGDLTSGLNSVLILQYCPVHFQQTVGTPMSCWCHFWHNKACGQDKWNSKHSNVVSVYELMRSLLHFKVHSFCSTFTQVCTVLSEEYKLTSSLNMNTTDDNMTATKFYVNIVLFAIQQ